MRWLLIFLFSASCHAAWDTNIWNSPDWSFAGYRRGIEMNYAVNEKLAAVDMIESALSIPPGIFGSWVALTQAKATIKPIVPLFVDWRKADAFGHYTGYLQTNNTIPMLSVTGLLAYAGAQTNFFEYTPFFNLATASNGYRYVTNILNELRWTMQDSGYDSLTGGQTSDDWPKAFPSNRYDHYFWTNTIPTYSMCTNNGIISTYSNEHYVGAYSYIEVYPNYFSDKYHPAGWRLQGMATVSNADIAASLFRAADIYIYPGSADPFNDFHHFDAMGDVDINGLPLIEYEWCRYAESGETGGGTNIGIKIGTVLPYLGVPLPETIPTPATNDFPYGEDKYASHGWILSRVFYVIKWDGPNGFKYK